MRKFDRSWGTSRSSYFATFRQQLTILANPHAVDQQTGRNPRRTGPPEFF
ncbi:phage DNA packaging protein C [Enterobacter intestinihominis]